MVSLSILPMHGIDAYREGPASAPLGKSRIPSEILAVRGLCAVYWLLTSPS